MKHYITDNCFENRNIIDEEVEKLLNLNNINEFSKLQMLYSYYKLSGDGTVPEYVLNNLDKEDIKQFDEENEEFEAKYTYYNKRHKKLKIYGFAMMKQNLQNC